MPHKNSLKRKKRDENYDGVYVRFELLPKEKQKQYHGKKENQYEQQQQQQQQQQQRNLCREIFEKNKQKQR